jgi:hypothetical protein
MRGLHQLLFLLAISVGLAGVIFLELDSGGTPSEATLVRRPTTDQGQPAVQRNQRHPDPQQTARDLATIVARPLFSPTRRRGRPPNRRGNRSGTERCELAGVVIEPDGGTNLCGRGRETPYSVVGEALNGWKLDGISPE